LGSAAKWKDALRQLREAESRKRYDETFVPCETFFSSFSTALECTTFALRTWRCDLAWNRPSEMLHMIASDALPTQRPLLGPFIDCFENRIRLIANRFERDDQRLVRRVHRVNSNCSGLPVNLRDIRAQRRKR
jgi:hypothetical protein